MPCLIVTVGVVWAARGTGQPTPTQSSAASRHEEAAAVSPSPSPSCSGGWSCTQQKRFAAAKAYVDKNVTAANAYLSVRFTDRTTGKSWSYGDVSHPGWTASTIKLAMATDILMRARAGDVTLSSQDRNDLRTMLNFSDENAADRLWSRYGSDAQLARFRSVFGMTSLAFQPGFTDGTYWGFVKCTSLDLSHLMTYVLTKTNPDDRDYLVAAMRGVATNQQWGVWAAGAPQKPGNKDGWSYESDSYGKHWVLNSVGFAGPDERYTIGIMFQVQPGGSEAYGAHTVSDVVALLFGRSVPASIIVPTPDG